MIKLVVMAPLPALLGLSSAASTLNMELPYLSGISILTIFEMLAERYPVFERILRDKNNNLICNLMIFVDGTILISSEQRKKPLGDECEITFMTPYSGG